MRPVYKLTAWLCGVALFTSGCLFSMEHQLPARTYFGRLPERPLESRKPFESAGAKNWYLAGFLPYTSWGSADLLAPHTDSKRIENLEIETLFTRRDTLIWVFPGFVYGYYVWAPRTIRVRGTSVQDGGGER